MAKVTTIQHFSSIASLAATFSVSLPKPHDWRLIVDCPVGSINGIPSLRGVAIATNGILIALLRNERIEFGHLDSFVQDIGESVRIISKTSKPKATKQPISTVNISEYI